MSTFVKSLQLLLQIYRLVLNRYHYHSLFFLLNLVYLVQKIKYLSCINQFLLNKLFTFFPKQTIRLDPEVHQILKKKKKYKIKGKEIILPIYEVIVDSVHLEFVCNEPLNGARESIVYLPKI
jgi:hypothetical protein